MKQRRIVFSNRKGGCGKTASAVNVAAGLALVGKKVLLVDCDPQGHASVSLGFSPYEETINLYDLLNETNEINEAIKKTKWPEGLSFIPATGQLAAYELEHSQDQSKKGLLAKYLLSHEAAEFDYILMDPPPTVGLLNLMCMIAAKEALIPVQTHFLSMEGLAEMVRFIYQINATVNPDLRITGIIPTFYNRKFSLAKEVVKEIKKNFGEDMLLPAIRQSMSIAESPGFGDCIFKYAPGSNGAFDYARLVEKIDGGKLINPFNNKKKVVAKKKKKKKKK